MDGPSHPAHLVLLHFGRTRVALAQRAVRSLEAAADVDFAVAVPGALGTIAVAGAQWPVYALDQELALLRAAPRERRICALLATETGLIGLLCDEAQVLPRLGLSAYPLPLAMRRASTPLEGVLSLGAGVALLSSARALAVAVGAETGTAAVQSALQAMETA
jgi:hypothetical protein